MGKLFFYSGYQPKIFPLDLNPGDAEFDRLQSFDVNVTLPRDPIYELGRDGIGGWIKGVPEGAITARQLEYGSLEAFLKFANKTTATTSLTLADFDTSAFDIVNYLTDNGGTFIGSLLLPELRLSGFSVSVPSPTDLIERNWSFVGEQCYLFQGANKYYVESVQTVGSSDLSGSDYTVTLNDPTPIIDPDTSTYIYRVTRVRSTVTTYDADLTYTYLTGDITIEDAAIGDVYKISYTAGALISGESTFVENDTDLFGIRGNSAVLYLGTSNRLYKVQSATLDVTMERDDVGEIGTEGVTSRGVKDRKVRVTLGKLLESDLTMEELLRGVASGYTKIDFDQLSTDLTFILAIYSDSGHGTFKIGFSASGLAVTEGKPTTGNVQANTDSSYVLEGSELTISNTAAGVGL